MPDNSPALVKLISRLTELDPRFVRNVQQDASEFLLNLFRYFEKSAVFRNPFCFDLTTTIECSHCCTRSSHSETHYLLNVPITDPKSDNQLCRLLDTVCQIEHLTDYHCDICKTNAQMKVSFLSLSSNFLICLKRTPATKNTAVIFDEVLYLTKYVSQNNTSFDYDLSAVITHLGDSLDQGHYICYRKNLLTGGWFMVDDARVMPCETGRVMRQQKTAYMLFYTRKNEQSPVVPSENAETSNEDDITKSDREVKLFFHPGKNVREPQKRWGVCDAFGSPSAP
ncbi:unnamed protein product, partial [Didymodactylos carnosus]